MKNQDKRGETKAIPKKEDRWKIESGGIRNANDPIWLQVIFSVILASAVFLMAIGKHVSPSLR